MQARGPRRRRPPLDDAPRAPFLSPVVPSKRAAPKEPRPVPGAPSQEVDAKPPSPSGN